LLNSNLLIFVLYSISKHGRSTQALITLGLPNQHAFGHVVKVFLPLSR
jgi:hypothetical protein